MQCHDIKPLQDLHKAVGLIGQDDAWPCYRDLSACVNVRVK